MIKIINKYYEPEIKEVRCIISENELNKTENYIFYLEEIIDTLQVSMSDLAKSGFERVKCEHVWKYIERMKDRMKDELEHEKS